MTEKAMPEKTQVEKVEPETKEIEKKEVVKKEVRTARSVLSQVCAEVAAPKGRKAGNRYEYRNVEDINEALKPICKKYHCGYILADEIVTIPRECLEGRYYVKAKATFYLDEKKDELSVSAFAREDIMSSNMATAQVTGAASSYARKYALCGLFRIDNGLDVDDQADKQQVKTPVKKQPPKKAEPKGASQKNIVTLANLAAELAEAKGVTTEKVLEGVISSKTMHDLGAKPGQREFNENQCETAIKLVWQWLKQARQDDFDKENAEGVK